MHNPNLPRDFYRNNYPQNKDNKDKWIIAIVALTAVIIIALFILFLKPFSSKKEQIREIGTTTETQLSDEDTFAPLKQSYEMRGTIVPDNNSYFTIGPAGGYYVAANGRRDIRVHEWDEYSGRFVVSAYKSGYNGDYLGQFDGYVERTSYGKFQYKGTFTNYKGNSVKFDLEST